MNKKIIKRNYKGICKLSFISVSNQKLFNSMSNVKWKEIRFNVIFQF